MTDSPDLSKNLKFVAAWPNVELPSPPLADEVHMSGIRDVVYLAFGQVRVPTGQVANQAGPVQAQILPVAQVAMTRASLRRMIALLQQFDTQATDGE
jgi:hypothetical protein